MPVSPQARKLAQYLGKKWRDRLILIPTPKGALKGFITSCLCPERYPFDALVKVYWERLEIERSYGELKQYQLQNKPTLRSKKKVGVYQEL
nr:MULTISPECIES: hypothetical protein [Vibrio]